jgi:glycosyltransferase involved in cell wall biosynthesis
MALRLGIVASDIPPIAEAIGDVDWPLVKPDDGGGLAEGLLSVLEGGAVSEARKDAGERRFYRLFTADTASEGMASLYLDVVRGTRSRP